MHNSGTRMISTAFVLLWACGCASNNPAEPLSQEDVNEADALVMDGLEVSPGDLISKHLYAGTVGGPHLHFETRYYRLGDAGDETFYGSADPFSEENLTEPSAGQWSYGVWNPEVGYGFGHPSSHGLGG